MPLAPPSERAGLRTALPWSSALTLRAFVDRP